jgi:ribA/ribD-fused uncharacterized protein
MTIRFFSKSDTHREFSNFAAFPIELDGERWPTTEHCYQAQKFTEPELQARIRTAPKPIAAKKIAETHRNKIRPDWDAVKDDVMYRVVRRKFETHAELRELLRATGNEDIVADRLLLGCRERWHRPEQAWPYHRAHSPRAVR